VGATFNDSKEDLKRRAQDAMVGQFGDAGWTLRQKVALTCRALFDGGHDSGLAGQITARAEQPGTFFTQQLGLGFDEITAAGFIVAVGLPTTVTAGLNLLGTHVGDPRPPLLPLDEAGIDEMRFLID
jgi:Class II Aldolase and Adducin N-terminal domain